jgi:hypothetical protein
MRAHARQPLLTTAQLCGVRIRLIVEISQIEIVRRTFVRPSRALLKKSVGEPTF